MANQENCERKINLKSPFLGLLFISSLIVLSACSAPSNHTAVPTLQTPAATSIQNKSSELTLSPELVLTKDENKIWMVTSDIAEKTKPGTFRTSLEVNLQNCYDFSIRYEQQNQEVLTAEIAKSPANVKFFEENKTATYLIADALISNGDIKAHISTTGKKGPAIITTGYDFEFPSKYYFVTKSFDIDCAK